MRMFEAWIMVISTNPETIAASTRRIGMSNFDMCHVCHYCHWPNIWSFERTCTNTKKILAWNQRNSKLESWSLMLLIKLNHSADQFKRLDACADIFGTKRLNLRRIHQTQLDRTYVNLKRLWTKEIWNSNFKLITRWIGDKPTLATNSPTDTAALPRFTTQFGEMHWLP